MDFIIGFFRDVLDGPLYVITTIINIILICSCIGYLAEQSLNKKKQKEHYDNTHATIENKVDNQLQNQTNLSNNENLELVTPSMISEDISIKQGNSKSQQTNTPETINIMQDNIQVQNQISQSTNNEVQNQIPPSINNTPIPQTIQEIPEQPSMTTIVQQPTNQMNGQIMGQNPIYNIPNTPPPIFGPPPSNPIIFNTIQDINNQTTNQQ